jgi:hypothetical protein
MPRALLRRPILDLCLVFLLSGCSVARVTPVGGLRSIDPPFKTIAIAPQGGVFADLIGIELSGQGYAITDSGATLALSILMHIDAGDLFGPQVLGLLKQRGIDAVLEVEKVDGKDGLPQTVHVRLYSTARPAAVGGIDWENSWIRRGTLEAAQEIAAAMGQDGRPSDGGVRNVPSVASSTDRGR